MPFNSKGMITALSLALATIVAYWLAITKVGVIERLFSENKLGYAVLCVSTMAICGTLLGFFADSITNLLGWKIERVEEAEVERLEE
ncbi:MAG: hypothetical protein HY929_08810 [Euryarchaeota archaeon]|nr:hypothetical protein [Euryarchaeota archaeon]